MDTKDLGKVIDAVETDLAGMIYERITAFKEETGLTICSVSVYLRSYEVDDGTRARRYMRPEVTVNIDVKGT